MPNKKKRSVIGLQNYKASLNRDKNEQSARDAQLTERTHVVQKRPFTERSPEILKSQLRSGAEKAETVETNDQNHAILFESNNMAALIQQTSCSQCQSKGTLHLLQSFFVKNLFFSVFQNKIFHSKLVFA